MLPDEVAVGTDRAVEHNYRLFGTLDPVQCDSLAPEERDEHVAALRVIDSGEGGQCLVIDGERLVDQPDPLEPDRDGPPCPAGCPDGTRIRDGIAACKHLPVAAERLDIGRRARECRDRIGDAAECRRIARAAEPLDELSQQAALLRLVPGFVQQVGLHLQSPRDVVAEARIERLVAARRKLQDEGERRVSAPEVVQQQSGLRQRPAHRLAHLGRARVGEALRDFGVRGEGLVGTPEGAKRKRAVVEGPCHGVMQTRLRRIAEARDHVVVERQPLGVAACRVEDEASRDDGSRDRDLHIEVRRVAEPIDELCQRALLLLGAPLLAETVGAVAHRGRYGIGEARVVVESDTRPDQPIAQRRRLVASAEVRQQKAAPRRAQLTNQRSPGSPESAKRATSDS